MRSYLLLLLCFHCLIDAIPQKDFPIKHWLILMEENRSFDNLLGFLKRLNPDIEGLTGTERNPYDPYNPTSFVTVSDEASDIEPNAGHSFSATLQEVFGGFNLTHLNPAPMNGFVANAESMSKGWGPLVMRSFNHTTVPVLSTLAMEFGLIDHWFSSVPGPTEVNRAFLQSATSDGYTDNDSEIMTLGFPQKPLMESISDAGQLWKVYFEEFPTALFMRELRSIDYLDRWKTLFEFFDDCQSGNLPYYAFIEPRYYTVDDSYPANDQHPSHNVADGEVFIKEIYKAVRNSPQWNETALIILYDEHGGLYDHVPTPLNGVPSPDGKSVSGFQFDRLGVRVPAVFVSPWVKKGTLVHKPTGPYPDSQFEHSSVAATIKKVLGIDTFLTKRDAWAATFEGMFLELDAPRTDCPIDLPNPPYLGPKTSQSTQPLNDLQKSMIKAANGLMGYPDNSELLKTEKEGGNYVKAVIEEFLKQGPAKKHQ
eukprot:TRINITY_DN13118_c0_g1_i1.p1 TRINITY_DN13118_c0_g1~~TRINITY_DN13118_c0_g1_i1.p1  ORF type:complete len:481 (-),score=80.67 TRINITY_DN13118_c0_g1_i1:30-1472(-)